MGADGHSGIYEFPSYPSIQVDNCLRWVKLYSNTISVRWNENTEYIHAIFDLSMLCYCSAAKTLFHDNEYS
jgi:hypothetical protein